ncbi:carbohydrate ABC transporter permease [Velocimicrobium porci]|uniref:Sugar ABC transporter permease n=1 Tax=Velocimicrobium porci TaxID=2606634 RepID=A0A6L5XX26_9FIRM|nr:sugar ABC transporter permease [Velocimicrobium porci]MSS63400.1 sugar ABC transporter permease [Velocimicrobium porci]
MLYKKKWPLIVFLIPGLIMMGVFLYYPFISNIGNSFYNMSSVVRMPGVELNFIGLENYKNLFKDPYIKIALKNSFLMMILTVIFQVGLALVFAILVNSIRRGQQLFRTLYFFPVVISASALGLLFKLFYDYNGGMLNQILEKMGKEPVMWLSESLAFTMISIPVLWSYVGFYFVIILTGICDIPDDVYEAAAIDGCSGFKSVFYITVPLLRGVLCTCITLAVTGALKVFDLPWMLAEKGAPNGTTHFLGTYMYHTAFSNNNFDYGSTIALFIVVVGVIVSKAVDFIVKPDKNL